MNGKKARKLRKKFSKETSELNNVLQGKDKTRLQWFGGRRKYKDAKKEARHG